MKERRIAVGLDKTMLRKLSASIASNLGYRPDAHHWAARLPQLQGHFRRSKYENGLRVFYAAFVLMLAAVPQLAPGRVDRSDPIILVSMAVMVGLAVIMLWPLGRSYVFKDGELSLVSRRGHVVWREDLRGLEYVTCSGGAGRSVIMTLRWPDRRRRIEVFGSLEKALSGSHRP